MIYITGDTHGGYDIAKFKNKTFNKDDIVIICGDFGYVFAWNPKMFKQERAGLEKFLETVGCTVLFVDGNHENFHRLENFPTITKFGGKVQRLAKNCFHLLRGEHYEINGFKFLALGGAESHDKERRLLNYTLWSEETITEQEANKAIENLDKGVDYVITHSAPAYFQQKLFKQLNFPYNVYDENHSCQQLERVLCKLVEKQDGNWKWFMGHYHVDVDFKPFYVLYNHFYCVEEDKWV